MADEDKFADEIMSDEQLEQIAGGDELVLDGLADRFYARSKVGDFKPDVNASNPANPSRILIVQ